MPRAELSSARRHTGKRFARRVLQPELMDTETVPFEEFRACLRDLERVNRLTFTYRPVIRYLDRLRRHKLLPKDRPVVIVDIGFGYGGLLRRVDRWARRRDVPVTLIGVDLNPWSAKAAAEATPEGRPIQWVTADLFEFQPPQDVDLILSSQFTHHLDDLALLRFLKWMEGTARVGWFIADLHRHPIPYHVFRVWAWLARWHRFVRHDGPVSIGRAFKVQDWIRLLVAARISDEGTDIVWRFPFRLCVSRIRVP